MVETQYQGLQSEVDDMRQLIKNFRVRYKQAVNEIQDLNQEHAKEKIEHFEQVTNYEKELALYRGILKQVVSGNELVKIEQRCSYDEVNTIWSIPSFQIDDRKVFFKRVRATINVAKEVATTTPTTTITQM